MQILLDAKMLTLGVALAAATFATGSAEAKITSNGAGLNGTSLNGVSPNGLSFQGREINGANLNGVALNGTDDAAEPGALRVAVVRLPGGRVLSIRAR